MIKQEETLASPLTIAKNASMSPYGASTEKIEK